jgi:hypothetical protein
VSGLKLGDVVRVKETGDVSRIYTVWRPVHSLIELPEAYEQYELTETGVLFGADELELVQPFEAQA